MPYQSSNPVWGKKKHSTSTAIIKVLNYLMVSLDNETHSATLFIDSSKAFDFVDNGILKQRLLFQ